MATFLYLVNLIAAIHGRQFNVHLKLETVTSAKKMFENDLS